VGKNKEINKIYDFTLTFHWEDGRDSSLGIRETGCDKEIIISMENIFPGSASENLLEHLQSIDGEKK